ncbi:MAG: MarR family winged helix-turn-helix transcriptional regulator [Stackebrandtia sp.]
MSIESDYRQWTRLVTLHGRVEQRLTEALQTQHALGLSEYRALCHLASAEDGELRMQELSDLTGLNQSSVTRLVHRLEKTGLAERSHCANDRRGVYTVITDLGRRRQADARPTYAETLSGTLDDVASREESLTTLVGRLRATR